MVRCTVRMVYVFCSALQFHFADDDFFSVSWRQSRFTSFREQASLLSMPTSKRAASPAPESSIDKELIELPLHENTTCRLDHNRQKYNADRSWSCKNIKLTYFNSQQFKHTLTKSSKITNIHIQFLFSPANWIESNAKLSNPTTNVSALHR